MSHLIDFDGPLGFVTLHPLFTFGGMLLAALLAAAALRRPPRPR